MSTPKKDLAAARPKEKIKALVDLGATFHARENPA